ncbi:hypothetical protein AFM16_37530 [Streptomyces antibioticus]|uniref:Uncharacterized protein n=1 Tax=Streptomyces antibioticus TaxID=1890 RepID=A0ABX3LC98_STRAT|nr:hypothetical protein AFM16_37530 [Streptomyces antibioticus]
MSSLDSQVAGPVGSLKVTGRQSGDDAFPAGVPASCPASGASAAGEADTASGEAVRAAERWPGADAEAVVPAPARVPPGFPSPSCAAIR